MNIKKNDLVEVHYLGMDNKPASITKLVKKSGIFFSGRVSGGSYISVINKPNAEKLPEGILEIRLLKKYYPEIKFMGSKARVRTLIKDIDNQVVYINLCGQEDMVRSISAMILQGRMTANDHSLFFPDEAGYCKVPKEGSRRIIQQLGEGMATCIIYHRTFLPSDNDMSLLWHHENDSPFKAFQQFLQLQSIPRLKSLENGDELEQQVMTKLEEQGMIKQLDTCIGSSKASQVLRDSLVENDYEVLREAIIEVLRASGYSQTQRNAA